MRNMRLKEEILNRRLLGERYTKGYGDIKISSKKIINLCSFFLCLSVYIL